MTTRGIHRLAAALALIAFSTTPAAAQAIALGESAAPRLPTPAVSYRLTLTSAWPQSSGAGGCDNGGDEVVEGVLTRSGPDRYQGSFHRRTTLLFCGAHGSSAATCALVLHGEGTVAVTGLVVPDDRSPSGRSLRLIWTPEPDHDARVDGACAPAFKRKVEEMYLTVRHGVEFALPAPGAAPSGERLEDYAWTVVIE